MLTALLLAFPAAVCAATSPWFPLEPRGGHLMIRSVVEGRTGYALLDTGAQVTGINSRFVANASLDLRKGERMMIRGVNSTDQVDSYETVNAQLLNTGFRLHDLPGLDLGDEQFQLLLGAPFLERFVLQFDYPNRRVRALTRGSARLQDASNVRARRDSDGSLIVRVRLNDEIDAWLLLDTGSTGGLLLDRKLANSRGWMDGLSTESQQHSGVNSSRSYSAFVLPLMRFGPFELQDVMVSVPNGLRDPALFARDVSLGSRIARRTVLHQGVLGYDVLRHFVVTIDYRRGDVHIARGE